MKYILRLLVIGGMFISCSKEEVEPLSWRLASTFVTSEGENLFDDPNYDKSLISWSPGIYSSLTIYNCDEPNLLPGVDKVEFYIDFGNGDTDTLNYKWDDGRNSSFPDIYEVNWIEVYYNKQLVKKWAFNNREERIDFGQRNCWGGDHCSTDCSSPDVINIVKN